MTTENVEVGQVNTPEQNEQEQIRLAQIQQVRNALVQNIFQQYYQFINALKILPVQQQLPGMLRAYGHIDDGMLWVKEIINTAPLVFAPPSAPTEEKKEEPAKAPEDKTQEQIVESPEQSS